MESEDGERVFAVTIDRHNDWYVVTISTTDWHKEITVANADRATHEAVRALKVWGCEKK